MEARWVERPEQTQTCQRVLPQRVNVTSRGVGWGWGVRGVCTFWLQWRLHLKEQLPFHTSCRLCLPVHLQERRGQMPTGSAWTGLAIGGFSFEKATKH